MAEICVCAEELTQIRKISRVSGKVEFLDYFETFKEKQGNDGNNILLEIL